LLQTQNGFKSGIRRQLAHTAANAAAKYLRFKICSAILTSIELCPRIGLFPGGIKMRWGDFLLEQVSLSRISNRLLAAILLFLSATNSTTQCAAQLCGQLSGVSFTENFNTLAASGAGNTSASVPPEFAFNESPGNLTYAADNGSNASADTYSYGATGSADRALGEITSVSVHSTLGACFTNNTNHAFNSLLINYTGEEWRRGVSGGAVDRLDFQYSTDALSLLSGTYINVDALDFVSPSTASSGAKDGNSAAFRTVFAPVAITPAAPIQPEATFYLRWLPALASGANDGLAIDDFSIGTVLAPGVAGDYNENGVVDGADYVIWRKSLNQSITIPNDITPGTVVAQDFREWRDRFGNNISQFGAGAGVPEPAGLAPLTLIAIITCGCFGRGWSRLSFE
jgi:hypothetical protein